MKKNRVIYVIIAIIIIAGVINTFLNKFAFSLAYDSNMRMDIYIGKDYNKEDIKDIASEAIGTKDILIQDIETFGDMVAIVAKDITEEQKGAVIAKINEKYGVEIKTEDVAITSVPHYDGRDLLKRYILPIGLSAIIILVYVIIRYNKLGSLKIAGRTIAWSAIIELLYISIISLFRIPVSFYTIPLALIIEIFILTILMNCFEKELAKNREESRKKIKEEA